MLREEITARRVIVCDTCRESKFGFNNYGQCLDYMAKNGWIQIIDYKDERVYEKCPTCIARYGR